MVDSTRLLRTGLKKQTHWLKPPLLAVRVITQTVQTDTHREILTSSFPPEDKHSVRIILFIS